ncbi:MAG: glycerophosphodiester phosphodiesterase [Promethearchaeota archaeon]
MNEKPKNKIFIIGHRGANSIAPENTLKAFQKAIELGADCVEFDVHESKDGKIVVMHDEDIFRTTGQKFHGLIKDMTLEELRTLDCGEGEKIPTFKELISLTKGKIGLNCEIKAEGIAKKIVAIMKDADIIDTTIVSSFKHPELLKIQKLEPKIKLASLEPAGSSRLSHWENKEAMINKAVKNKFYAIHPLYKLVDRKFIEYAHNYNLKVIPWTVDSGIALKKLMNMGPDAIITNDISRMKEILKDFD